MKLALCALLAVAALALATPLDDYVNKPDPAYKWHVEPQVSYKGKGWYGVAINLTSQQWLDDSYFAPNSRTKSIWMHQLVMIVPDSIKVNDTGLVWITGGENGQGWPSTSAQDIKLISKVAVRTGTVCASLFQIPNEPVRFADDAGKRRVEDMVIAYTWEKFMADQSKPEWLLRLPMTKAVVRAMDTMTAWAKQELNMDIGQFMVAGASKRGWTTWTTGAVDKRVVAIAPLVMDMLNFVENVHHMYRAYGGWTWVFEAYYNANVTARLDSPELAAVAAIVDPYVYLDRLTMPKLVVSSAGDEFFMPDDTHYWWDDVQGESHFLIVQNAEHTLATGIWEVVPALEAFVVGVTRNSARPEFSWDISDEDGRITVKVEPQWKPKRVLMQFATTLNNKRRDFRLLVGDSGLDGHHCYVGTDGGCLHPVIWLEQELAPREENTYVAAMAPPAGGGWHAFFVELQFDGPEGTTYTFTTEVSIVPRTFPFENCHGEECRGTLV